MRSKRGKGQQDSPALPNTLSTAAASNGPPDNQLISPTFLAFNTAAIQAGDYDAFEARAIAEVFGSKMPVFALKGQLGNSGAASGLTELLASIQALQTGERPGTLNFEKTDLGINVQKGVGKVTKPYAVKISYTDMGQCAVAVIKRWKID